MVDGCPGCSGDKGLRDGALQGPGLCWRRHHTSPTPPSSTPLGGRSNIPRWMGGKAEAQETVEFALASQPRSGRARIRSQGCQSFQSRPPAGLLRTSGLTSLSMFYSSSLATASFTGRLYKQPGFTVKCGPLPGPSRPCPFSSMAGPGARLPESRAGQLLAVCCLPASNPHVWAKLRGSLPRELKPGPPAGRSPPR